MQQVFVILNIFLMLMICQYGRVGPRLVEPNEHHLFGEHYQRIDINIFLCHSKLCIWFVCEDISVSNAHFQILSSSFNVYYSWVVGRSTHHVGSVFIINGLWGDPLIMQIHSLVFMVCREAHPSCRFSVYYSWFVGRPTHHVGSVFIVHGLQGGPPIMQVQCLLLMVCRETHSLCRFIVQCSWFVG